MSWLSKLQFVTFRVRHLGLLGATKHYCSRASIVFRTMLSKRFPTLPYSPTNVQIEPTTRCNLKCNFCELTYWKEQGIDLEFAKLKQIIERLPSLKSIILTGLGEPLMNQSYIDFLEFAKRRGLRVIFFDNFTLLTEKKAKRMIDMGVDEIVLSLDGATKETYEGIRVGANFDKVVRHAKSLVDLKNRSGKRKPEVYINSVGCNENYWEMPGVVKLADEMGIPLVQFTNVVTWDDTEALSAKQENQKRAMLEKLEEAVEVGTSVGVRVKADMFESQKRPVQECNLLWEQNYITVDGYVHPCCHAAHARSSETHHAVDRNRMNRASLGNIFEQSYDEIWNSPRFVTARKQVRKGIMPEVCEGCPRFYGEKAHEPQVETAGELAKVGALT